MTCDLWHILQQYSSTAVHSIHLYITVYEGMCCTVTPVCLSLSQWKSGPVVQLGWTVSDELLCVQEDGSVLIYDLFGSFKRHFSMGQVSLLTS